MNADGSTAASSATGPGRAALVFRLTQIEAAAAGAGELNLVPARRDERQRRDVARLALERGPDGFVKGAGPIRQIVLPGQPTFDEMLAAEFVARLLAGDRLPEGCATWAEYAKLVREGLRPGEVPLERSVEGIFLALLNDPDLKRSEENDADVDLTLPSNEEMFCRSWTRLARRVMDAAQQGVDPFTTPLLDDAEFARQRTFLARDREVYRQDVTRGQRWIVSVPDGPPQASGLLLRKPRSLLFKHWARCDGASPSGDGYLLLAVQWAESDWVFSTDPVHRQSLKPLWELLQTAEAEIDPRAAAAAPWFDGAPFNHTLIAAPRGRSTLPDETIVQIVKQWCQTAPLTPAEGNSSSPVNRRQAIVAAGSAAGLLGISWFAVSKVRSPSHRGAEPQLEIDQNEWSLPAGPRNGRDYALLIATDRYDHWQNLGNPILDAKRLAHLLEARYGFETEPLEDPTTTELLHEISKLSEREWGSHDQLLIFIAGHGDYHQGTQEGFLALRNSLDPRDDPTRESFIAHSRLRDMIEKIPCDRILVILDVCFGGTFDFGTAVERSCGGIYQQVSKQEFIRRKMARPSRRWLTSGAKELVPDGRPGEHSPFALRLIEVLEAGGDAGIVTFGDIITHVEKIRTEPREGALKRHAGGDFLFIRQDDFQHAATPGDP